MSYSIKKSLNRMSSEERAHAEQVRELAGELFDLSQFIHGLPDEARRLVTAAGALHDVGLEGGSKKHGLRSGKMILEEGVDGFTQSETRIIAALAMLHRGRPKPKEAGDLAALNDAERRTTVRLAAILRVADGLDYTHRQAIRLREIVETPNGVWLRVKGNDGNDETINSERAEKKADLWNEILPVPIHVTAGNGKIKARPFVTPRSSLRQAGMRILRFHFSRMRENESGVRERGDVGSVHDMRVAMRRIRAALRVFAKEFDRESLKPFGEGLKRIASKLGPVRDLDVFDLWLGTYLERAPRSHLPFVRRLLKDHQKIREEKLAEARTFLEGEFHQSFLEDFERFLRQTALTGDKPGANSVAEAAPKKMEKEWRRLLKEGENVAEASSPETLHRLRIKGKKVRYAFEFFRDAYPKILEKPIQTFAAIQDRLGAIHDLDVFMKGLREYTEGLEAPSDEKQKIESIADRVLRQWDLIQKDNLAAFRETWAEMTKPKQRKKVDQAVEKAKKAGA